MSPSRDNNLKKMTLTSSSISAQYTQDSSATCSVLTLHVSSGGPPLLRVATRTCGGSFMARLRRHVGSVRQSDKIGQEALCQLAPSAPLGNEDGHAGIELDRPVAFVERRDLTQRGRRSSDNYPLLDACPPVKLRDAFGRDKAQQDAGAVPVLLGAFHRIAKSGWLRPYSPESLMGGSALRGLGLSEAVKSSSLQLSGIDTVYAINVIRRLEFFFIQWEAHPMRTKEEVLGLLAKAIVLAGGDAPRVPRGAPGTKRRGGWGVAS